MGKENERDKFIANNLGQKVVYLGAPVVADVSRELDRSCFTSDLNTQYNTSTPLTTPGPDTLPVVGKLGKPSTQNNLHNLHVAAQRHKGLEVKELRLQKGSFPDSIYTTAGAKSFKPAPIRRAAHPNQAPKPNLNMDLRFGSTGQAWEAPEPVKKKVSQRLQQQAMQ